MTTVGAAASGMPTLASIFANGWGGAAGGNGAMPPFKMPPLPPSMGGGGEGQTLTQAVGPAIRLVAAGTEERMGNGHNAGELKLKSV